MARISMQAAKVSGNASTQISFAVSGSFSSSKYQASASIAAMPTI